MVNPGEAISIETAKACASTMPSGARRAWNGIIYDDLFWPIRLKIWCKNGKVDINKDGSLRIEMIKEVAMGDLKDSEFIKRMEEGRELDYKCPHGVARTTPCAECAIPSNDK